VLLSPHSPTPPPPNCPFVHRLGTVDKVKWGRNG
jgi:hypothetical protein